MARKTTNITVKSPSRVRRVAPVAKAAKAAAPVPETVGIVTKAAVEQLKEMLA